MENNYILTVRSLEHIDEVEDLLKHIVVDIQTDRDLGLITVKTHQDIEFLQKIPGVSAVEEEVIHNISDGA